MSSVVSALIQELLEKSAKAAASESDDYTDRTIEALERLKDWRRFWSIEIQYSDLDSLNRKGNVLGGSPFVSQEWPWPVNSSGNPLLPLIQICLDEVTLLSGKDFGAGLLQVWIDVSDADLQSIHRVVEASDLEATMTLPAVDYLVRAEANNWELACANFSIVEGGFMCSDFEPSEIESRNRRELTDAEFEVVDRLMEISKGSNYQCLKGDWLFGYPDMGSGAPAGRYTPEPSNFFQFKTSDSFSMVNVSRYANIFFSDSGKGVSFFFDWNG